MKKDRNMLTDKDLAKNLNVRPKLIRDTVEKIINNYNIDPNLVIKGETKSGSPKWLIHKSLSTDLAKEILPDLTFVRHTKRSYDGRKPSLDDYDGNYE